MSTELTRLVLTRAASGAVRLSGGGGVLRAVLLERGPDWARVSLMPQRMLLLDGDDVALKVEVGSGLRLELSETGGTVAHDMRGGRARWRTAFHLRAGAALTHHTWPWVSCAGSDVERSTEVRLGTGARAVLRETLVLGRHGELPGRLRARTRVLREEAEVPVEVLVEELCSDDLDATFSPTGHRVLDQVLCLGPCVLPAAESGGPSLAPGQTSGPAPTSTWQAVHPTRLDLASGDHLWRALATDAHHAAGELDRVCEALTAPWQATC